MLPVNRIKRLEEEVVLFRKSALSAEERLDVIVNDIFKGMRTSMNSRMYTDIK
jgi:DNA-binding Lrp family transcriptional regulator